MERILAILKDIKPECNFEESQNFIIDGYLDSFDVVALVSEIEQEFNILIDALDILPENFCNIEAIATLIEKSGGKI